jgi:1-acyl-sn-glycerol-3-phosphate acyltransferase
VGFSRLGAQTPRRGNAFSRAFGRTVLRALGWRFVGRFPDLPKFVLAAAPHTSNWDFVVGMAALFAAGIRLSWMGKHTLFRPPFGAVMRWMGGLAVDRRAAHGIVDQTVAAFERSDQLAIGMTPEGTRARVDRWRTGFYNIATKASVPIVLGFIDYDRRRVGIGPTLQPSGDIEADFEIIRSFYAEVTARHPENFGVPTTGSRRPR